MKYIKSLFGRGKENPQAGTGSSGDEGSEAELDFRPNPIEVAEWMRKKGMPDESVQKYLNARSAIDSGIPIPPNLLSAVNVTEYKIALSELLEQLERQKENRERITAVVTGFEESMNLDAMASTIHNFREHPEDAKTIRKNIKKMLTNSGDSHLNTLGQVLNSILKVAETNPDLESKLREEAGNRILTSLGHQTGKH